jgi:hypothetical protein
MSLCFNWASRHTGVAGSGGVAPRTLDLGTKWGWVASFTPQVLYPQGKSPWNLLYRRPGGLQNRSGRGGEEKSSQLLAGLEPLIIQPVAQRCNTELSRLPYQEVPQTRRYEKPRTRSDEAAGAYTTAHVLQNSTVPWPELLTKSYFYFTSSHTLTDLYLHYNLRVGMRSVSALHYFRTVGSEHLFAPELHRPNTVTAQDLFQLSLLFAH